MTRDPVTRIEIDEEGRLHVVPRSEEFPFVWREALEVHWDSENDSLYSPSPRTWSYGQWLVNILTAAREQGCQLDVTTETEWLNVPLNVRKQMQENLTSST